MTAPERSRRLGLGWIELHILNPNNRPSPFCVDESSDELNVQAFIDLVRVVDCTSSSTTSGESECSQACHPPSLAPLSVRLASAENILRCNVWARGSQAEIEPVFMSNTLLQAFSFALADYITEYKLLPTLFANQRHGSLEPPASPRSTATVKFADETSNERDMTWMRPAPREHRLDKMTRDCTMSLPLAFILDRNVPNSRASAADAVPTTPIVHSRRVSSHGIELVLVSSLCSLLYRT